MPFIAQQDYLHIEIADSSALTVAEKAEIAKAVNAGTIFDYLVHLTGGISRVVELDEENSLLNVSIGGTITALDFSE